MCTRGFSCDSSSTVLTLTVATLPMSPQAGFISESLDDAMAVAEGDSIEEEADEELEKVPNRA